MSQIDLEATIEDAISDSLGTEPTEVESTDSAVETQEATPEASESTEAPVEGVEAQTPTDAPTEVPKPAEDDFDKKFGLTKETVPGRENRIPYSRVRKIVEKATKDTEAGFSPKIKEFEAKVADYEGRLEKVARFEKIMVEEPERFITMLKTLPQYQSFFQAQSVAPVQAPQTETQPQTVEDPMPEPDQTLEDGRKIYSMEAFQALQKWNRDQARKEALAEVQKQFGPIQKSFEAQQQEAQRQAYYTNVIIPQITAQIEKAKKWPLFNENEAEITKALDADRNLTLEGAYNQVVVPKLIANRDKMRQEVLQEIRKVPASTAAPSAGATKPVAPARNGPRDLEEVIREQISGIGNR